MELVGRDTVNGGNSATEDVIGAVVLLGLLKSVDVKRLLYDKDGAFVAFGGAVEWRDGLVVINQSEGDRAGFDAGVKIDQGLGDVGAEARATFEQKISVAFGGTRADAGQMPESFNRIR